MNAVVTLCIGDLDYAQYALPSMEKYAKKIGCAVEVIDQRKYPDWHCKFEIFQIEDLLEKYDRILYLDADIIVTDNAPNVFEEVDEDKLGCVIEESGKIRVGNHRDTPVILRFYYRHNGIKEDYNFENIDYFNSGVLVLSQCHKDLFKDKSEHKRDFFKKYYEHLQDQTYLNYIVDTQNIPTQALSRRFNFLIRQKNICRWMKSKEGGAGHIMLSKDVVKESNIAFLHFVGPNTKVRMEAYLLSNKWKDYVPTGYEVIEDPTFVEDHIYNVRELWNNRNQGKERLRQLMEIENILNEYPWSEFPKTLDAWELCTREHKKLREENKILKNVCSKIEELLTNSKTSEF